MRIPRIVTVLILMTLAAPRARSVDDLHNPAFWVDRADKQVASAPVIEYDGHAGTPRLTAAETAADLFRLDPTPEHRKLLADKLAAADQQLASATQPWRRWYGHLVLARVCRAALQDEAGYRRHVEAAAALDRYLPDRQADAALYARVRGCELAAAGDAEALRREAATAASTTPTQLEWYAQVADRCINLGLDDGARAALDQLTADASALPGGPEQDFAGHLLAAEYAKLGEFGPALDVVAALDGPRKFDSAVRVLRAARLAGRADVIQTVRDDLANVLPPTVGPLAGEYVAEIAAAGDPTVAVRIGRDALKRGPGGQPSLFFASLAAGLAAAGDREAAANAAALASQALDRTPDPKTRARALLAMATAHACNGDFDAMTRAAESAAKIEGVTDADVTPDRARLVDALLDRKRWDDVTAVLAPIHSQREREAWTPRIVAAQVRAGVTDLAVATARKPQDGFIRARALRRVAVERGRRNDLAGLPDWIDQQLDTPLRRAATDLAIAQVLAGKPVRATGFPPDEE
jgi:hypothetical protein